MTLFLLLAYFLAQQGMHAFVDLAIRQQYGPPYNPSVNCVIVNVYAYHKLAKVLELSE